MATSDLITVLIVNWNSGDLLARCLRALQSQTVAPNRILIVDNDSHDHSLKFLDGLNSVDLIRSGENLGFAAANNLAIEKLQTPYFATLNPDAFPEPEWLENLVLAVESHPEVASFACRQMSADHENIVDGLGDVYHFSGLAWRRGYGRHIVDTDYKSRAVFSACGGAALYRTEIVKRMGGFDEDFFCYMEDVDLGFRLRLAGYDCVYLPDAVVRHIGSASTGKDSDFTVYHGHRNLIGTYVKNMPGVLFWVLMLPHIGIHILALVYYSLRGRHRIIFKAKIDGLLSIPLYLKKRRSLQTLRSATLLSVLRAMNFSFLPLRK